MSKKKEPLVSIIIPVYNAEDHLVEALASVVNQSYSNIEIIAVNDGSTDRSLEILELFKKTDPRIRIISQKNGGIVTALNRGIASAKGELIARMDADDISFIRRIEKQVNVFNANPDYVLVTGGFEIVDEQSEFLYREILPSESDDIKRLLYTQNPIAHGSVMFKKDVFHAVGGYSDKCGPTEDYELWIRMANTGKYYAMEDLIYRWRQNRKGITLTNNVSMQKHAKIVNKSYWQLQPPARLKRSLIIERANFYIKNHGKYGYDMKNVYFYNLAQVSAKMIGNGQVAQGLLQMLSLASTGRLGLRSVRYRVLTILRLTLRRIFNA